MSEILPVFTAFGNFNSWTRWTFCTNLTCLVHPDNRQTGFSFKKTASNNSLVLNDWKKEVILYASASLMTMKLTGSVSILSYNLS